MKTNTGGIVKGHKKGGAWCNESTSRERPKSALYLRLKIVKAGTLWAL